MSKGVKTLKKFKNISEIKFEILFEIDYNANI